MKLHSSLLKIGIFCAVFYFFVITPIFTVPAPESFSVWTFPLFQAVFFASALFLFFFHKNLWEKPKHFGKLFVFYDLIFPATFSLCILFSITFFLNGIALLVKFDGPDYQIAIPKNATEWLFCILTFLLSASFEEILYRFYLPEFLLQYAGGRKKIVILIEVLTALFFAFAHSYAGLFAVLNALFAHIVLRCCYKKTSFIGAGIAAHFIYNLVQLFLTQL